MMSTVLAVSLLVAGVWLWHKYRPLRNLPDDDFGAVEEHRRTMRALRGGP
jgi:hypothetical protein